MKVIKLLIALMILVGFSKDSIAQPKRHHEPLDMKTELNLSDQQWTQWQNIEKERRDKIKSVLKVDEEARDAKRNEMKKMREAYDLRLEALLDENQKKEWQNHKETRNAERIDRKDKMKSDMHGKKMHGNHKDNEHRADLRNKLEDRMTPEDKARLAEIRGQINKLYPEKGKKGEKMSKEDRGEYRESMKENMEKIEKENKALFDELDRMVEKYEPVVEEIKKEQKEKMKEERKAKSKEKSKHMQRRLLLEEPVKE